MVNKKGILRILEASIAILIIFAVIISFSMTRRVVTERDLSEMISPLLEEIAKNNTLREDIISSPSTAKDSIMAFLAVRIKEANIEKDARICEIDEACGRLGLYPTVITGNIYAGSRLISSSLIGGAQSKRVSIFLWAKS